MEEIDLLDFVNEMLNELPKLDPEEPPAPAEASPLPESDHVLDPEPSLPSDPTSEPPPPAIVRMQNRVIERTRQSTDFQQERLPSSEIACTTCPFATWTRVSDTLKAHCGKMFLVTWSSDEPNDLTDCSAREEALLQLL